jgi:hypothetical protein
VLEFESKRDKSVRVRVGLFLLYLWLAWLGDEGWFILMTTTEPSGGDTASAITRDFS